VKYIDILHTRRVLGDCDFVPEIEKFAIRIFKPPKGSKKIIKETITHEIGHILYRYLTSKEKLEWEKLWWKNIRDKKEFITEYASTGCKEDFAECFSVFKFNSRKLKNLDITRYNFIKKIYFSINKRRIKLYHEKT